MSCFSADDSKRRCFGKSRRCPERRHLQLTNRTQDAFYYVRVLGESGLPLVKYEKSWDLGCAYAEHPWDQRLC